MSAAVPAFAITARDRRSARAGVLQLAHGEVRTPAFVPLATKATVKGMLPAEVAALGYEMVLGNTFHLFLAPGHELIGELGGLHAFMGWEGPIITDSGGFQVFSMGHGTVADEIKGRAPGPRDARVASSRSTRRACASAPTSTARSAFMAPETSMEVQAALGSDIALAFDECTPFHVARDYTARSTERTHRWLDRCLDLARGARAARARSSTASCRAASTRTCAAPRRARSPRGGATGSRSAARSAQDKAQMHEVVGWATGSSSCRARAPAPPARHRRRRRPHPRGRARASTRSTARCRRASAATAWRSCPSRSGAGGSTSTRPAPGASREPMHGGLPLPGLRGRAHPRLPPLPRARPASSPRCACSRLHNLTFMSRVMADLRAGVATGTLPAVAAALRAGAAPGAVAPDEGRGCYFVFWEMRSRIDWIAWPTSLPTTRRTVTASFEVLVAK